MRRLCKNYAFIRILDTLLGLSFRKIRLETVVFGKQGTCTSPMVFTSKGED